MKNVWCVFGKLIKTTWCPRNKLKLNTYIFFSLFNWKIGSDVVLFEDVVTTSRPYRYYNDHVTTSPLHFHTCLPPSPSSNFPQSTSTPPPNQGFQFQLIRSGFLLFAFMTSRGQKTRSQLRFTILSLSISSVFVFFLASYLRERTTSVSVPTPSLPATTGLVYCFWRSFHWDCNFSPTTLIFFNNYVS